MSVDNLVPVEDWLCRFIRPGEWNSVTNRPLPVAFRASNRRLSGFHVQKVRDSGSSLSDLCIDGLSGAGEAHIQTKAVIEAANDDNLEGFEPNVYWRPDNVELAWEEWTDAHAHIESDSGDRGFPKTYRIALSKCATLVKRPAALLG